MKKLFSFAVIASLFAVIGCQESADVTAAPAAAAVQEAAPVQAVAMPDKSPMGKLAIFDLNAVADETGMLQSMSKKMGEKAVELKKNLETFHKDLQKELEKQAKDIQAKIKKNKKIKKKEQEFKKQAMVLEQGAQIKFRQAQAQADQALNLYRVKLVSEIREAIRPVAKEVSEAKGFKVLLLRNPELVFDVSEGVDLTQEILVSYQAKHPDAVKKPEPEPAAKDADKGEKKADKKPAAK
jgi:Skp family chaperone for outer membrane proteins